MNERFRELLNEATSGLESDLSEQRTVTLNEMEKFAELIVRECAEMVRIQNEKFMENESHYGVVSTDVLKHFGVEL